jgi:hypothetical protein
MMTRLMAVNEAAPEAFARLERKPSARGGMAGIGDHGLTVAFTFHTDSPPYLQIWHDFRPYAGVLGVEPCTTAFPVLAHVLVGEPDSTCRDMRWRENRRCGATRSYSPV